VMCNSLLLYRLYNSLDLSVRHLDNRSTRSACHILRSVVVAVRSVAVAFRSVVTTWKSTALRDQALIPC